MFLAFDLAPTSALRRISCCTTAACPPLTAKCSAVKPCRSGEEMGTSEV